MLATANSTHSSDVILAHPRFVEARQAYMANYLAIYSGNSVLNKLLAESARHVIITFVVCLAAAQRDDEPQTWLTLGKLQDTVAAYQVGSPGRVEALVGRLIRYGMLTATPAPTDRRKRILAPTSALLAHDRDLIVAQAQPGALVLPSAALEGAVVCDRAFHVACRQASIAAFGEAMALLGRHPEIIPFLMRDSGMVLLYALLESAHASPGGNVASFTFQGLADRFGVSRTHVRDLIVAAELAGLMQTGGGPEVQIAPSLWQAIDRWIADAIALFADCCERAMAMVGEEKVAARV